MFAAFYNNSIRWPPISLHRVFFFIGKQPFMNPLYFGRIKALRKPDRPDVWCGEGGMDFEDRCYGVKWDGWIWWWMDWLDDSKFEEHALFVILFVGNYTTLDHELYDWINGWMSMDFFVVWGGRNGKQANPPSSVLYGGRKSRKTSSTLFLLYILLSVRWKVRS